MKEAVTIHRAKSGKAEGVIYAPHPWASSDGNSYNRYHVLAQQSGWDVITPHVAGTGRAIITKAARRELRRGNISDLVMEETYRAQCLTASYATRIGLGDSGRGIWIARMQTYDDHVKPFTHVVVRDAFNANAPESFWRGTMRLLKHGADRTTNMPVPQDQQSLRMRLSNGLNGLREIRDHAPLMLGKASANAMAELAVQADTPVHSVVLGRGIGGPAQKMREANEGFADYRKLVNPHGAPFITTYEEGWAHGDLLAPEGIIKHIRKIVEM